MLCEPISMRPAGHANDINQKLKLNKLFSNNKISNYQVV
jgi:hypothetical protein